MATRLSRKYPAVLACLLVSIGYTNCAKDGNKGQKETPTTPNDTLSVTPPGESDRKFKYMLGINGFEWEFLSDANELSAAKTDLIKPFAEFRHYLDWHRIEDVEGEYTFSPTASGNWSYDDIYAWCKQNDVNVLTCLKTVPDWFLQGYYPANQRDEENAPAPYGADKTDPASYLMFSKLAFQFAARYGSNANVDPALVSVAAKPSWAPNQKKIGLNLIKYIECNNEPDRWWKGAKAQQSAEEYAANLSAFYDGHQGKLGPGVGVKSADPNMIVVMGGLAGPDPDFVRKMVAWCLENRGLKSDGSVDLCFDVVNYHHYSNNKQSDWSAPGIRGEAPEISESPKVAQRFVEMANDDLGGMEVWVTELGYDNNPNSPQRALAIAKSNKSIAETQADWSIRSCLMYARLGIQRIHFYMLNDVNINSSTQYSSSGFVDARGSRRPALDYVLQTRALLGEYHYSRTLATDPFVDLYELDGKKIYVLVVPDEIGREATYELEVGTASQVKIYHLQAGSDKMRETVATPTGGKLTLTVTETPLFVEPL
ncbi:hypothetical protein [Parapedobacter sp. 2B3]|uniref:hypothetical protein n=1 Tax=Parapedobacter sp. 2B3 TaxID=3342381 RepID=UPI0035B67B7E